MAIRTFLLLSVLFFVSCTVTKRVHRKGFHVEWNRHYTTNSGSNRGEVDDKTRDQIAVERKKNQSNSPTDSILLTFSEMALLSNQSIGKDEVFDQMPGSKKRNTRLENAAESPLMKFREVAQPTTQRSTEPDFDEDEQEMTWSEAFGGIAWVLIALGTLLLIGTLVYLFGYGGFVNLFNLLVFSGNGFLFGALGFLLFLAIFIAVIGFALIVEFLFKGPILGYIIGFLLIGSGILIGCIKYRRGY
jgi:hypothetical protein